MLSYSKAYTEGENYSGWNLTKINYPDGKYSAYAYNTVRDDGINRMTKTMDSETMLGWFFSWRIKKKIHSHCFCCPIALEQHFFLHFRTQG